MKKLLVTAIGAAAAFGAIAGEISTQRIKDITDTGPITVDGLNTVLGNYWSEPAGATNTYAVSTLSSIGMITPPIDTNPGKALDVKTTFGKPLSVNIVSGGSTNIPNSGIYFDSLVKFTVCEDTPTETYDGAKIIMWLQEQYDGSDNVTGTNLMVRAGYLSYNEGAFPPVSVTPTNYVCTFGKPMTGDFADQWHRVTIKAIPDITTGSGVPGFAIYIDGSGANPLADVNSTQAKWDSSFTLALNEGAKWLNDEKCLFPSMVQAGGNKGSLTQASFDGTGSITDIIFTDEPMAFAADYVAPKATVTIGSGEPTGYGTLAEAVDAVNAVASGTVTFQLSKGMVIDAPLAFESEADVILDFAGLVLTNNQNYAAITNSGASLTITNSVGAGGILCTVSDTAAIHTIGQTWIAGGNFWADVGVVTNESYMGAAKFISGGAFADNMSLVDYLVDGKVFAEEASAQTGLYEVIDYVPNYVAQIVGGGSYETLKEAIEAASAGATVAVLQDCEVAEPIVFSYGITVSNDYTVSVTAAYALRIFNGTASPVTFCGSGTYLCTGTGSPFLVGNNEETAKASGYGISGTYAGSMVLESGTLKIPGTSNNLVKVENGTFVMNGGEILGGSRGIKADADAGTFTSTVTINGGVISNAVNKTAVAATAATGTSTVTINGGDFTGIISKSGDNATLTIPGTSTARFAADWSTFCETGYATTQSGDWYVVGLANYTISYLNEDGTAFTDWAEYVPTTSYTIEDAVTLPTSSDVQLGLGVEFGGWTNETGTVTGWAAGEKTGNVTVYAKLNPIVPSGLDPASGTTNVTVTAASEADAIAAAKSAITVPAGSGATAADYANLFNYSATAGAASGTYDVAITGIKDEVVAAVNADAVGVFSGDTSVSIPAGLYYRVTPSTALPISGTSATGLSNGSAITVTKPGSTQGFIKVELSSGAF